MLKVGNHHPRLREKTASALYLVTDIHQFFINKVIDPLYNMEISYFLMNNWIKIARNFMEKIKVCGGNLILDGILRASLRIDRFRASETRSFKLREISS